MKKLSIICTLALVLGLMAGPVFAFEYCKDYLEDGNPGGWAASQKSFEEEVSLQVGSTVFVDVWLNDLRPDDTLIGGSLEFFWTANLEVVSITPYDTVNGGPWDPGMSIIDIGTNSGNVILGNLGCVSLDAGGDLILAKLEIHKVGEGTGTITFAVIPGFSAFASCIDYYLYDPDIDPNTFTINGGCQTKEDCDDGLYCNGEEFCVEGICQDGADPCLSQICNEDTNSCESTHVTTTTTTHTGTTTSTITISSTTSTTSPSWQKTYNEMWGDKKDGNLSLLRTFRDEVLANSELGREYTSMFYDNSLEILTLLIQDPSLTEETKEIIDEMLPGIYSVLDGSEMILSKRQLDDIKSLLARFETKASRSLSFLIQSLTHDMSKGKVFSILLLP